MTRGDPYGSDILSDRGPHPKNAGDRLSELGMTISVEALSDVTAGNWVNFDGAGGVDNVADPGTNGADAVVAEDAAAGDDVAVHTYGVVRAVESANNATDVDSYDDGDVLVKF